MVQPPELRSDQDLIAAANAGEVAAFEALYDRYRQWVVNLATRFTHDRESALDVMQETFFYLMRKFPGFELTGHMKTFLYPVVRHTSLAIARKSRRHTAMSIDRKPASCTPPDAETHAELAAAMQRLDAGHREAVILRVVEDLSLQEIAFAMDLPLGTVKSRLHHAFRLLQADELLRKYFKE